MHVPLVRSKARTRPAGALAAVVLGAAAIACGSQSSSPGDAGGTTVACPVANGCPDAGAPSYQNEILPIMQQHCVPCHGAGSAIDESSYARVFAERSPILDQVNGCAMPPTSASQLKADQRILLTGWLECGAPNN